jgi:hypothetical protein
MNNSVPFASGLLNAEHFASTPATPDFPSSSLSCVTLRAPTDACSASTTGSISRGDSRRLTAKVTNGLTAPPYFSRHCDDAPGEETATSTATITAASSDDFFYASLIAARQLRRQRDATEGGLSATTAALVSPVQPSLVFNSSLTAIDASQSPRTLQDLLTWRQNMLETRMREHARQDSADPSWSVNSPAVRNEAFTRSTWSAGLLTPQTPPTPCTVLNSQSPLPHERRHTHTTEAGEGEKGEKGSCPEAALHHAASPGSAAHPSSHPASSGMPSRTASHLLDVTPHTPTSEEIYEMVHIHDIGVGHAIFARIGLSLLLLLVLSLIYDAPFLPGGGWALL